MTHDLVALIAETRARLTGPDGDFEIVEETVRGVQLPVFKNRRRSLGELFASTGRSDRDYLVHGDRTLSYRDHATAVASLASTLAEQHGVGPGDRVAVFAANSPEWVITLWAAACLGAITVGYNAWWSRREVEFALEHSTPKVVVADAERAARLEGISGGVVLSIESDLAQLMEHDPSAALPRVHVDEDQPAVIMYTSGTTGYPKGAVHSHRNMLAVIDYHRLNDALAAAVLPPRDGPRRFLMSLPLFHIASLHNLVLPRLVTGDTVVIDSGRFEVERVLRLIERERITNWAIVPTMAHRLVNHDGLERHDLSSLSALSVNSAPSSAALKDRLRAAVPAIQATLADSYGLTEACTAATVATAGDLAQFPTTVGRAIATVSIEIRDGEATPLPDGVEGEICLRSQYNMLGYWGDDAATAAVFAPDGWLRTGDIGCLRDGLLYMSTRRSDLILRGGENVYPAEIEAVLDEHPAVAECVVFGVEHVDLGEEVAAVIVPRTDVPPPTEEQLREFTSERLAYYKVPSRWRITTTPLPRTATGKVIRRGVAP